jgi:hypothetical protein
MTFPQAHHSGQRTNRRKREVTSHAAPKSEQLQIVISSRGKQSSRSELQESYFICLTQLTTFLPLAQERSQVIEI